MKNEGVLIYTLAVLVTIFLMEVIVVILKVVK